jgi:dolichol-phosphate mannosyltransferase
VNGPGPPSFAVVVPAFNEEAGIARCVEAVDSVLERLANRTEIIVVDDGSADGTREQLAALQGDHPRLVVATHAVNSGYGAALRTGIACASERAVDYVVFMDSDLTNHPAYLSAFAEQMAEGFDVIKASRYVEGGGVAGVPIWRTTLSRLGNLVARLLFGLPIRDCTNGFRAVRTQLVASLDLRENSFAVIMEELYRLRPLALSYREVPIVLTARGGELRGSSFSFGLRAMAAYLRYPLLTARDRVLRRSA